METCEYHLWEEVYSSSYEEAEDSHFAWPAHVELEVDQPDVQSIACNCISEPQLTKVDVFAEYSYGGKKYLFTDPVGRMCECPICQGVVKEAQSVKCCKKTFCKDCLDEAMKRFKRCPLCRTQNPVTYENDAIDDGVNDLKVLCLHHGKGCEWSGHLLHEPQHREEKCDYEEVECKNRGFGCEVVAERRLMKQHVEEECDFREVPCKYCNEFQRVWEMEGHLPACPEHPVECVNGCGEEGLLRRNIAGHLEVCPEAVVDCPFKEMGCRESQLKMKDIQSHTTNAMSDHLALVMKTLVETKQAMQKQADVHQSETRGLNSRIDQLQMEVKAQRDETEGLRARMEQLQLGANTGKPVAVSETPAFGWLSGGVRPSKHHRNWGSSRYN